MHQGIGDANVGRVPTAVNGCFGVNTAAVREVLVVVVVSATCRGTQNDVLLYYDDDHRIFWFVMNRSYIFLIYYEKIIIF